MYKIIGWGPNRENQMGGSGFSIIPMTEWKESVKNSNLNQDKI